LSSGLASAAQGSLHRWLWRCALCLGALWLLSPWASRGGAFGLRHLGTLFPQPLLRVDSWLHTLRKRFACGEGGKAGYPSEALVADSSCSSDITIASNFHLISNIFDRPLFRDFSAEQKHRVFPVRSTRPWHRFFLRLQLSENVRVRQMSLE